MTDLDTHAPDGALQSNNNNGAPPADEVAAAPEAPPETEPEAVGQVTPAEAQPATARQATPAEAQPATARQATPAEDQPATARQATMSTAPDTGSIAGVPELKGLLLYAAVLSFAGLYVYFIVRILQSPASHKPALDGSLVTAAAALAGVLGSAFALEIGVPVSDAAKQHALRATDSSGGFAARVALVLSLEPSGANHRSWPKTLGVWAYAVIGSAVAITYITNQSETPTEIKALAVAFAGYVLALVRSAYNEKTSG